MIGRVTSQQLLFASQQQINATKLSLSKLESEASTGVAVSRPSDDPAAMQQLLQVHAQQSANTQYASNISDGLGWLGTADSTMTSAENLIRNAIDLTTQGANTGAMTSASADAIATQLDGVNTDLLNAANTQYLGRPVFAGNADTATPFTATTDPSTGAVTYSYTAGSDQANQVQRRISGDQTVSVSADGAAAFGSTTGGTVFDHIAAVAAKLRQTPPGDVSADITTLQQDLGAMSAAHATVGANYARLEAAQTSTTAAGTALEAQRSGIEDADTTQTILDLKSQELTYQTALQVTAASIQPTLMSFLS